MINLNLENYITHTKLITRNHKNVIQGSVYVLASHNITKDEAKVFIDSAITSGAKYIVISNELYNSLNLNGEKFVSVSNPQLAWAYFASLIYTNIPSTIAAVTGTCGKTSVAYMYCQFVFELQYRALYIGTLGAISMSHQIKTIENTLTTPDVMDLRRILSEIPCEYACIEASSHGIDQQRLAYIQFTVAAFTNLSLDHLDYHESMENYYKAKEKLFLDSKTEAFVLNTDDDYSVRLINQLESKNVLTYGKRSDASLLFIDHIPGQSLIFSYENEIHNIEYKILGEYNVYNFLCAIGMLLQSGFKLKDILFVANKISLPQGRMERIANDKIEVFVDYAHKPEALKEVLIALEDYKNTNNKRNIWVVFGCGGERDTLKRSIMGQIASVFADHVIVTNDNPRNEDPELIRKEVIKGIVSDYFEIENRQDAIEYAISNAKKGDIILIAGKGHENYQIIGNEKIPFSDIEVAKALFEGK